MFRCDVAFMCQVVIFVQWLVTFHALCKHTGHIEFVSLHTSHTGATCIRSNMSMTAVQQHLAALRRTTYNDCGGHLAGR